MPIRAIAARAAAGPGGGEGAGAGAGRSDLLDILQSATNLSNVHEIDTILERRVPAPVADDVRESDIGPDDLRRTGPVLGQTSTKSGGPATESDFVKAHVDVYGRPPPDVAVREQRIAALEEEVRIMPPENRRALKKALSHYPLLYLSSTHAKLIIEDEDFEPRAAARRLARYWEHRAEMFGSRAFSDGVFTSPTYHDYLRYYDKCLRISNDSNADSDKKHIASEYIRCVHLTKIAAMDRLVESASPEDKDALLEAQAKSPEVAASDGAKLNFLRCEDFVEVKAVERMLRYWKAKRLFFGPDVFHRRVTLADMDGHIFELEHFRSFRIMPEPDAHGRAIIAFFPCDFVREGWTEVGAAKFLFYLIDSALESEDCRRNGAVYLMDYRHSTENLLQRISTYRQIGRTIALNSAPVKMRAIHVWFRPSSWWQQLFAKAFNRMRGVVTSRIVIHAGSDEENMSDLEEEFDISRDLIPAELGGDALCDDWSDWIETRRRNGQ